MAERVLRDITIIIFRHFSSSQSIMELNEQHMQQHKLTGMQFKIQRGMSTHTLTPETPDTTSEQASPAVRNTAGERAPCWDVAALRIITFLSSRINPNVVPPWRADA